MGERPKRSSHLKRCIQRQPNRDEIRHQIIRFSDATGRRVLVLGDIRELGEHSKELHASISEVISPNEVALVYLYGEEMEALYDALKGQFDSAALHHYMDKEALIADLKAELKEGDQVLIKSSNGTGLLAVVDALKAE